MITKLGLTSIFVTHDQDEAIEVADQIIVTNQGRVEQVGSPTALYREPASPFVARFIGNSTVIKNFGRLKGFEGAHPEAEGAIRPEFLRIYTQNETVQYQASTEEAVVERLAFRGDSLEVGLRLKDLNLAASYSLEKKPISVGETVRVLIYRLYAFEGEQAALLHNHHLGAHPQGYSYTI
jgi:sulfate transport system ATP-binding protein